VSRFVVDASVAIKWCLPEPHDVCAARLRREGTDLDAPDLLYAEIGNTLWKRVRRGELTAGAAGGVAEAISRLPIAVHPSRLLSGAALQIACSTGLTVYDSLYLATALLTGSRLVTADRRLFETAGRKAPLRNRVLWVEDIPA
jgi:predicted nucleic acid-binding protein